MVKKYIICIYALTKSIIEHGNGIDYSGGNTY